MPAGHRKLKQIESDPATLARLLRAIRERGERDMTLDQIADAYRTSRTTIRQIARRHLTAQEPK